MARLRGVKFRDPLYKLYERRLLASLAQGRIGWAVRAWSHKHVTDR